MKNIPNKKQKWNENKEYILIRSKGETYLFTEHEIEQGRARAKRNPEDVKKRCWLFRIFN